MIRLFYCFLIVNQIVLLSQWQNVYAANRKEIAVVKSQFDRIEKVLKRFRIPYSMIQCRDLEEGETYKNYRAIFFPCGIDNPIETNVNILSRGTSLQAVILKKDFSEINKEKIYTNIKSYIKGGGAGYFSGYSYEFLQGAFNVFKFHDNFPNMGIPGKITAFLKKDLLCYKRKIRANLFMSHSGWIAIESVKEADVLAEGLYKTSRGEKFGPLISIFKRGDGEALYTSYHNCGHNMELLRYIIFRISYKYLLDRIVHKAWKWEQKPDTAIVDSIQKWEKIRSYYLHLATGENTIYITSDMGLFQVDIYDMNENLILSRDSSERDFHINIDVEFDSSYLLRLYPSSPREKGAYAILSAEGLRILPHFNKGLLVFTIVIIILIIIWISRMIGPRKYAGRARKL
ncbi:MAG: hypothetical protein SVR08_10855 [Spirochaetota bacterium]|nr:hypothetical protein [Spirochaetota bacterium]